MMTVLRRPEWRAHQVQALLDGREMRIRILGRRQLRLVGHLDLSGSYCLVRRNINFPTAIAAAKSMEGLSRAQRLQG